VIAEFWAFEGRYKAYEKKAGDKNIEEGVIIDN